MKNGTDNADTRGSFHREIYDFIKSNCISVRELRQPLSPHSQKRAGKIIGVTDNILAEGLMSALGDMIGAAENETQNRAHIYRISVIHALGNVLLSSQKAYRRTGVTGAELQAQIRSYAEHLQSEAIPDNELINSLNELIVKLDPQKQYISAACSGMSYRVTYYDTLEKRRLQKSVNDILIVIGNADTRILDAPPRKERSDKQPLLGSYRVMVAGEWVQRDIYEFDERYSNRSALNKAEKN